MQTRTDHPKGEMTQMSVWGRRVKAWAAGLACALLLTHGTGCDFSSSLYVPGAYPVYPAYSSYSTFDFSYVTDYWSTYDAGYTYDTGYTYDSGYTYDDSMSYGYDDSGWYGY